MSIAGRLIAFSAGVAVALAGVYVADVVPWRSASSDATRSDTMMADHDMSHDMSMHTASAAPAGLSLSQDGYVLEPVQAPAAIGDPGTLSFTVLTPAGGALVDYVPVHEKNLHLIVVRSDGTEFVHAHPVLDRDTGTWSTPWTWNAAGTYRVFADFRPADNADTQLTLTQTVDVAGAFTATPAVGPRVIDQVDGYTVRLDGELVAGESRQLTATVTREGAPVTTLQPYLGAFGHLVALREGDLAYLHVHPEGAEPAAGQTGGPAVVFAATAPTEGRYFLYLDFQVDQTVHTATFVVDASDSDSAPSTEQTSPHGHSGGH